MDSLLLRNPAGAITPFTSTNANVNVETASVTVKNGFWTLWSGPNYTGNKVVVGPGTYPCTVLANVENGRGWTVGSVQNGAPIPAAPQPAHNGKLVQAPGNPAIYFVDCGFLRHVPNPEVMRETFRANVAIHAMDLSAFPVGAPLSDDATHFLVRNATSGAISFLESGWLRHVPSMPVFDAYGFNVDRVDTVDPSKLAGYKTGPSLGALQSGMLVKAANADAVYLVDQDKLRHVPNPTVLARLFASNPIVTDISKATIGDALWVGSFLARAPGEAATYLVDLKDGQLQARSIANPSVMTKYGFATAQVQSDEQIPYIVKRNTDAPTVF